MNEAELTPSLWLYAIHSNNAELIHLLESNEISPPKSNSIERKKVYQLNKKYSIKSGMVNVEKIDQRCHFFRVSLSTLTSLIQPQLSTKILSLNLIVQKRALF